MRASAICRRCSSSVIQRRQRIVRAGLDDEVARKAAHRIAHISSALRRHGRRGSLSAASAGAGSTARRIPERSQDRRRRAARRVRSRNASDGSTAGTPCADCASRPEWRSARPARQRFDTVFRQRGGDDQRPLGGGDPFGQRRDRARVGMRRGRLRPRLDRADRLGERRRQRLARQHQINWAARRAIATSTARPTTSPIWLGTRSS